MYGKLVSDAPYPLQQREVDLASGRSITVYNVVVFAGGSRSLSIQYATSLSLDQQDARIAEAAEVVGLYSSLADAQSIRRASAQICNTLAAAQMREPPEQVFVFERDDRGGWIYAGKAPGAPSNPPSN